MQTGVPMNSTVEAGQSSEIRPDRFSEKPVLLRTVYEASRKKGLKWALYKAFMLKMEALLKAFIDVRTFGMVRERMRVPSLTLGKHTVSATQHKNNQF